MFGRKKRHRLPKIKRSPGWFTHMVVDGLGRVFFWVFVAPILAPILAVVYLYSLVRGKKPEDSPVNEGGRCGTPDLLIGYGIQSSEPEDEGAPAATASSKDLRDLHDFIVETPFSPEELAEIRRAQSRMK